MLNVRISSANSSVDFKDIVSVNLVLTTHKRGFVAQVKSKWHPCNITNDKYNFTATFFHPKIFKMECINQATLPESAKKKELVKKCASCWGNPSWNKTKMETACKQTYLKPTTWKEWINA